MGFAIGIFFVSTGGAVLTVMGECSSTRLLKLGGCANMSDAGVDFETGEAPAFFTDEELALEDVFSFNF